MGEQPPHQSSPLSPDPKDRPVVLLFIDLQGFKNHGEFIVKEAMIADVNNAKLYQWLFRSPYSIKNLTREDEISALWCTEHHHGLFWDQGIVPYSLAGKLLEETLSNACKPKTDRPVYIFVTGDEKEKWLKQLAPTFFSTHSDIEVINIYNESSVSEFDYDIMNYIFDPCVYHDNMHYKCAFRTVCFIAHAAAHCMNFIEK
ncbi:hypothetical protein QAD02_007835 [Eretmocerus hayati]|uniref:Uncharacterized protein n=1 Tax=Eretmocerus hayati TaxID=131215 RepID=A0ACC2N4S4_9HYME|nr:hypothetical protein QAD02_007835 [Eretmocerus hayati]